MRRAGTTLASTACTLLTPWLTTTTTDLATFFGLMRATARVGKLADESLMHHCFIDRCSEDIVAQLNLADLFSGPEDIRQVWKMLKLREIYRHLSNCADRGDAAANIIHDIVVKTT